MNVDLQFLNEKLIGTTVPKPRSGTLSGHAAGEPFDKHVFKIIKEKYPDITYRQYEYLNNLYLSNLKAINYEQRTALIEPRALRFLLQRGKNATKKWSPEHQFEEKQDDTADILVINNNFFNIIDIKTFNMDKSGQPPNIISSLKLAKMCSIILSENRFDTHDITYVGVSWKIKVSNLECREVSIKKLFKSDPQNLYINWAAALQIQFHVKDLNQEYNGSLKNWCQTYLRHFVDKAKKRTRFMKEKWIIPFEELLE